MMKVVCPYCVKAKPTLDAWGNESAIILIGFGDHAHPTPRPAGELLNCLSKFFYDMFVGNVIDGLNSIKPQAIDVVFANPVERVFDYVAPDRTAVFSVVVDRVSPNGTVTVSKVG